MNQPKPAGDIHRKIMDSAGATVVNRAHMRSFSFNVFHMNAIELLEATHRVKDPSQGVAFMMSNQGVGTQAHRELNRHIHNFVSSALTLVEHTRIHMRKHYEGTDFLTTYAAQATATFAHSPVAQFVQGLRNYMVHRGLPNSQMFMTFTATPGAAGGSGTTETGIRISRASLLDWDGWKSEARSYIDKADSDLDVQEFAQEYLELATQFQQWLEASIADHHRYELEELDELHSALEAADSKALPATALEARPSVPAPEAASDFIFDQKEDLDGIALDIFGKVRELRLQKTTQGFPSEREAVTITNQDLLGPVVQRGQEEDGTAVLAFIEREGKNFGLAEGDYESLDALFACVRKSTWARESISDDFTEEVFMDWARARFQSESSISFSVELTNIAREKVIPVEVWAPIAHMEVEEAFAFGPVRIEPVTAALMERLASIVQSEESGQQDKVRRLLDDMKRKFQGSAAVLVTLTAEPKIAQDRALRLAQDAVALLRFFSPPAIKSNLFSPLSLNGAEHVPIARLIVLHENGLIYSERVLPKKIVDWRLSKQQLSQLHTNLFATAASLVAPDGLSEFALAVRASVLAYSKSTTFADPLDRLRNCVSAVEGIFLRHELEPRAHSIANRIALLVGDAKNREPLKQTVRKIYWLQEQPSLHRLPRWEEELIFTFTTYTHHALCVALANTVNFTSKLQFLDGIDRFGESPAANQPTAAKSN